MTIKTSQIRNPNLQYIARLTRSVRILPECAVYPQINGGNRMKYGQLSENYLTFRLCRIKLT